MEFKEIGNQYNKEISSTERYLLRIIKRYFSLEELNNAASINAIIVEAIARYKASINYEVAPVLSVNNKVGITHIDIHDLKGEMLFEKRTAFNKDFGSVEDTICAGDDPRLSNNRIPTEHHHKITDVTDLRKELELNIEEMILYSNHLHINMAILNKLQYSGIRTQIDLIELESIDAKVTLMLHILDIENAKLEKKLKEENDRVTDLLKELYLFIQRLIAYIDDYDKELEEELKKHIDDRLKASLDSIKENIETYANKVAANQLIDIMNNSRYLVAEQEISVAEMLDLIGTGESMSDIYNNSAIYGLFDGNTNIYTSTTTTTKESQMSYDAASNTIIANTNSTEYQMMISSNKYKNYVHEVTLKSEETDDDCITVVLAANTDDKVYALSLAVMTGGMPEHHQFTVIANFLNGIEYEIAYDDTFNYIGGWGLHPEGIRVRIERMENIIKIYRSEFGTPDVISTTPCITIDLSNSLATTPFIGASKYGYGHYSQNKATFTDISFTTIKPLIIANNLYKEQNIDTSVLSAGYITDTMEIEPEFTYQNMEYLFPYLTKDFSIECGKTSDNKIYLRICPSKYKQSISSSALSYKGDDLYFLINEPMTWEDAEAHCVSLGGHLATAKTAEIGQLLNDMAATSSVYTHFWLGGTDKEEEGTWKWITGETFYSNGVPVDDYYSNWGAGEPNNANTENCLELVRSGEAFYWNDLPNTSLLASIGKIEDYTTFVDVPIEFLNSKLKYKIYAKKIQIPYLI